MHSIAYKDISLIVLQIRQEMDSLELKQMRMSN